MSKGYWIARVDVSDPEAYKAYVVANAEAFRQLLHRPLHQADLDEVERPQLAQTRRSRSLLHPIAEAQPPQPAPHQLARPRIQYGATDDYGYYAVEQKMHIHDLHATILHLLGLDHEKLTYRHAGRDFRLTDVHGNVVKDILA